jgi:predicted  nucleic acid-binding Zn-ribbon protein
MKEFIEQLVSLAKTDKAIDDFEPQIEFVKDRLKKVQKDKKAIEEEIIHLNKEIQECELKRKKNELHLEELAQKLDELAKKSAQIRNEKELKALQLEEELAKDQINFANEEIARFENSCETKKEEKESLMQRLKELEAKEQDVSKKVSKELEKIELKRKEVFKAKEELISKIPQKILAFYEKIRRWAKNTAVVPVKKQACMGCFMKINEKTYSKIIKTEEIVTCPHCGRILYLEKEEEKE